MVIETKPRGRGRPRSFDIDEVTEKAAMLFWRRGYEGVSIDELTSAMGITVQSLYAAFGSKQKLFERVLAWYNEEIIEPVREALRLEPDVYEAIRSALRAYAREFTRKDHPPGCLCLSSGLCASEGNEVIPHYAAQQRIATVAAITARLEKGVADGQLSPEVKIPVAAQYVNSVIVGMAVSAQDGASTELLTQIAETSVATLAAMK